MQRGERIVRRLVPAEHHPTKALHPTLRACHHPAACLGPHVSLEGLRFFAPGADVGREAKLAQRLPHFRVVVTLVQTHPLRALLSRARAGDHHALHGLLHQFPIMLIGPRDDHAQGHSVRFGQHAPFAPTFGAIRGIRPGFVSPRGAPWSSPHPYSTSASPAPASHRTAPPRPSTAAATPPPRPPPGTDHAPWSVGTTPWHLTPSIASPCGERRNSRQHPAGPGCGACHPRTDGYSHAGAGPALIRPTVPRTPEIPSSLYAPAPVSVASFSEAWSEI